MPDDYFDYPINVLRHLNTDKKLKLFIQISTDTKYILAINIWCENEFLTNNLADTILFLEELKSFDKYNKKKFFDVVQSQGKKSLKIKNIVQNVYIESRDEAMAIVNVFYFYINNINASFELSSDTR